MGRGTGSNLLYGESLQTRARAEAPRSFEDLHTRFVSAIPVLRHAGEKGLGGFKASFVARRMDGGIAVSEAEAMLEDLADLGAVSRSVHHCCARTGNTVGIDSDSESFECQACETRHDDSELFEETRYSVLIGDLD